MEINRKNYEAYFLDYWENNLSTEKVAELMVFLEQYPELNNEFYEFEIINITPDTDIVFDEKKDLKRVGNLTMKSVDDSNYEEFIVAEMEGDLNENQTSELKDFINDNPQYKFDYNYYKFTVLKPEPGIKYKNKGGLKKRGILVLIPNQVVTAISVAASIILLIGIYFITQNVSNVQEEDNRITQLEKKEIIPPGKFEIQKTPSTIFINKRKKIKLAIDGYDITNRENEMKDIQINSYKQNDGFEVATYLPEKIVWRNGMKDIIIPVEDNNVEKSKKSFVSRFIAGLSRRVATQQNSEKKSFLEYTIEGYNLMADREVEVEKELDEKGNIIAYNINGERIFLSRKTNTASSD